MQHNGEITSFKLVHLRGEVSCSQTVAGHYSYWGCAKNEWLDTLLTNGRNAVFFPQNHNKLGRYQLPGIRSNSIELTFNNLTVPLRVATGQEFRVWYGEDLRDRSESDNGGQTCMDVYALYVKL